MTTPAPDQDGADSTGDTRGPGSPGQLPAAGHLDRDASSDAPATDARPDDGAGGLDIGEGSAVGGAEIFGDSASPNGYPDLRAETAPRTGADRGWVKALVGLATAVVVALLGFPLGLLWHTLAPSLPVLIGDQRQLFLADVEGEQRAAAEGTFILISIGAGIVLAIVVWIALRRFRGPVTAVALAIGGVGAGWLAWRFGHTIGLGEFHRLARTAAPGSTIQLPPDLRIKQPGNIARWHGIPYVSGDLLYLGISALVGYLLIAGFALSPSLGVRRQPRPAVSRADAESDHPAGGSY